MALSVSVWFFQYDGYEIQHVNVLGNEVLTQEDIAHVVENVTSGSYAFLFSKKHIMIFPRFALADALRSAYPRIRTLDIDVSGRQEVTISLSERKPHSLWCDTAMAGEYAPQASAEQAQNGQASPCYFLDASGYAFAKAPHFSGEVYTTIYSDIDHGSTHVGTHAFSQERFQTLNTFRKQFTEEGFKGVGIIQRTSSDYWLLLERGGYIKFDVTHDPRTVVRDVMLAVEAKQKEHEAFHQTLEYIDARFDDRNRIYFKFAS